jgi:hypothetical protein
MIKGHPREEGTYGPIVGSINDQLNRSIFNMLMEHKKTAEVAKA